MEDYRNTAKYKKAKELGAILKLFTALRVLAMIGMFAAVIVAIWFPYALAWKIFITCVFVGFISWRGFIMVERAIRNIPS